MYVAVDKQFAIGDDAYRFLVVIVVELYELAFFFQKIGLCVFFCGNYVN